MNQTPPGLKTLSMRVGTLEEKIKMPHNALMELREEKATKKKEELSAQFILDSVNFVTRFLKDDMKNIAKMTVLVCEYVESNFDVFLKLDLEKTDKKRVALIILKTLLNEETFLCMKELIDEMIEVFVGISKGAYALQFHNTIAFASQEKKKETSKTWNTLSKLSSKKKSSSTPIKKPDA